MSVYGPETERTEAERQEFREALVWMLGMVELEAKLCIAGDFDAQVGVAKPGEEECVDIFGWNEE